MTDLTSPSLGARVEVFLRFSTVVLKLGSPDTVRDPRGFAVKFYTEERNWDKVGPFSCWPKTTS